MPEKFRFLAVKAVALIFLLSAGCETLPLEASPNFSGDMVVVTDYAPFYRLGPQQAGGADRSLRTGERVMLQRKEFGYSRVQLEDDQLGYMANEDLQPAPVEPRRKADKRKPGQSGEPRVYEDDSYDNMPLPDPNLNILPEDIPLEPLPDLMPEEEPAPAPSPTPEPAPVKEKLPEPTPTEEQTPVSTST
jgi:hypothetical protein